MALVFTGGLTFAYMTRLFVTLFVERSEATTEEGRYISHTSAVTLVAVASLLPLMGCFTVIMDTLAGWGQGFFRSHSPDQTVHYFAWKNLESAWISIAIGVAVYLFAARAQPKIYAALWLEWLDLENSIYRPLLKFLIRHAVFLARVVASLPDVLVKFITWIAVVPTRAVASLPDVLVRFFISGAVLFAHVAAFLPDVLARRPSLEQPLKIGGFSLDLLLVGIGICIALIYVFVHALM